MARSIKRRDSFLEATKALSDLDPSTVFLYRPHTVTFLFIGTLAIVHYSRVFSPPISPSDGREADQHVYINTISGLYAAALVYIGYSVLQGPVTPMVRPHPAVWRVVHACMMIYMLCLIFLLFQDVNTARQLLKHIYPELGVELPERSYGSDCRLVIPGKGINWETISATVFDEFVIAHTVGWWAKALIIRNEPMLWTLSIGFELMELTFAHMLPNFNECWWDSWVLDVLVCNWLGIFTGMLTVKYWGSREYNWSGLSKQPTVFAKARRAIMQFTPYSWDNFNWAFFSSPARCLQCLIPVLIMLTYEVNAFFIKYILWIPPRNPLNTYRLILLFFMALPATKEYYYFIEASQESGELVFNKLGVFAWLCVAMAVAETLLCIKFGKGLFNEPWPPYVLWAWGVIGCIFALWFIQFYITKRRKGKQA